MITVIIAVGDRMFWDALSPILPKFFLLGDVAASSALMAMAVMDQFLEDR